MSKTSVSQSKSSMSHEGLVNEKEKKHKVAIHWFRSNGLRLHDNAALLDASRESHFLLPLCIIDPKAPFAQTADRKAGCIRANFILESLINLNEKIRTSTKNVNSRLVVIVGDPSEVLPNVMKLIDADALYYERDPAKPVRDMDAKILDAISKQNESLEKQYHVVSYETHNLHSMETYLAHCKGGGVAPQTYGAFTKIFRKLKVPEEVEIVASMPPLPESMDSVYAAYAKTKDNGGNENPPDVAEMLLDVPSLESLGYDASELIHRAKGGIPFDGGEDAGLELLKHMMKRTRWVCTFEKPETKPNALDVDTTGLSPYVKHGCVSPRRFFHELSRVYAQYPKDKLSQPPVSLHGQLMWREYNYLCAYTTPNFDKMVGNPVARQIPWTDDPMLLEAWKDGQTGYPFIDAIMTQLKQTGWIHHLARHAVACFLTRGDLWQSWEKGAAIFEEELIDADWSINNFNWQWLSCTAHFYQYFRCYSPVSFGKKTDPNGNYIRKWLPNFHNFPTKYIYEPWLAPIEVQRKTGVIVGETYPMPLVEHKSVSKSNMARMKVAYDAARGISTANENGNANEEPNSEVGTTERKRKARTMTTQQKHQPKSRTRRK